MSTHSKDPYRVPVELGIALFIVGTFAFFGMAISESVKVHNEYSEVRSNCAKTELVYFNRKDHPRFIYDCTGVELKGLKK